MQCSCLIYIIQFQLININIFNYKDSWLSILFSPVPTSLDNCSLTVLCSKEFRWEEVFTTTLVRALRRVFAWDATSRTECKPYNSLNNNHYFVNHWEKVVHKLFLTMTAIFKNGQQQKVHMNAKHVSQLYIIQSFTFRGRWWFKSKSDFLLFFFLNFSSTLSTNLFPFLFCQHDG